MITTEDVVRATGGILLNGDMRISFSGVSHDSRGIKPGELFVALKGPRFDGHDFVLAAIEAGARGALVEYWPENVNIFELHRAVSIVKVPDTYRALQELGAYWRRKLTAQVVGITGSSGKTTTKEFLFNLLKEKGASASPGNWNNLIGVPLSILNTPEKAGFLILELATNRAGEIPALTRISDPEVAVLLEVRPAHLEGFSGFYDYLAEKLALFSHSRGSLVYPFDQEEIREWVAQNIPSSRPRVSFGLGEGADFQAQEIEISPSGTSFLLKAFGESYQLQIPLLGKHFVLDLLAALAAASLLLEDWQELLEKTKELKTLPRRLELKEASGFTVIDDTYNANPWSLKAGVEVVAALKEKFSRALAVVGSMKELGEETAFWHQKAGEHLSSVFDLILVVGEEARELARSAGSKARFFEDKSSLLEALRAQVKEGDLVYFKASRAVGLEEVVDQLLGLNGG